MSLLLLILTTSAAGAAKQQQNKCLCCIKPKARQKQIERMDKWIDQVSFKNMNN